MQGVGVKCAGSAAEDRLPDNGGERLEIRRVLVLVPCGLLVECMRKQARSQPSTKNSHLIFSISASRITQGPAMAMPSKEDTPHFIFINPKPFVYEDPSTSLCDAWNRAIARYFPSDPSPPFTVHEGELNKLDADLLRCDCIVSPANSYGIMDGGCATYS